MPVAPRTPVVAIKTVSRHCQMSPGGGRQSCLKLRATDLDLQSENQLAIRHSSARSDFTVISCTAFT